MKGTINEEYLFKLCKLGTIAKLEKIKAEIKTNRDEWIKGQDAEWYTYDRCLCIIEKHISELKGNEYEPDDWDSLANAERDH